MKNSLIFCTGVSGSGKSYFIKNYLITAGFYNLKSATTRPMREGEQDGREYYFRNEDYFDTMPLATKLWVNEKTWKPGDKKWLYGVPEFQIMDNLGTNFTYDVIEPKYVRQMIDWFYDVRLADNYKFIILWFQPYVLSENIVAARQNMPNDTLIRKNNTCTLEDFKQANLVPDFSITRKPSNEYDIYKPTQPNHKWQLVDLLHTLTHDAKAR